MPTLPPHARRRIDSLRAQHPLWSDGATKSRYLALPNNTAPITPAEQIGFAPTGQWTFPSGTVFVKNFDLVVNATNPAFRCAAWKPGCWCATPTARFMVSLINGGRMTVRPTC
jgi:hypothetical protein